MNYRQIPHIPQLKHSKLRREYGTLHDIYLFYLFNFATEIVAGSPQQSIYQLLWAL
jgi:hypothetical protein